MFSLLNILATLFFSSNFISFLVDLYMCRTRWQERKENLEEGRSKTPKAQAKEHALKKAAEAGSSSKDTNELTFQEVHYNIAMGYNEFYTIILSCTFVLIVIFLEQIFGIDTIIKDWSSIAHIVAMVMDQGVRGILSLQQYILLKPIENIV